MKVRHAKSGLATSLGRASLILSLAAAGATGSLTGCAGDTNSDVGGDEDRTGSLGLSLTVAEGVTIDTVTYTITGNGFTKTGTIDVSGAPQITATIGGIPAGRGYTITLTATSADGNTTFTGSAQFDVVAGGTAQVTIHLTGTGASGNGSVSVIGTINVAPVIDEVTIAPLTVYVGSSITLSSVSRDPDQGPSPLTYYWSTTGGVIDNPLSPNATLTSDKPGTFTVKLIVSDGASTVSESRTVTFVNPDADTDAGAGASVDKPNILLIIADDLGAASTSLYPDLAGEHGVVPMPNLEALAERGLVFDNAWSSPACSPTRGTIVSGQYGFRTGLTNVGDPLPTDTVTLFDRLNSDTDYAHALFGKYHIGGGLFDPREGVEYPVAPGILQHIRDLGITTFKGILGGALVDYFDWTPYDINEPYAPTKTYATTVLTDFAIDYIRQHEAENPNKPWFIYQAFNAPHAANGGNSPYQVPPRELHNVDLSSVGNPLPGTSQTSIPVYQANIQALDTELGRLLDAVDFEKTTVIFIGDNGVPPPVTDLGQKLRDSKGSVYEGGVRVPLVIAGAGVTRRGREDALFVTTDLYATVLDLAGVNVSRVNDGYSIKPLLSDEHASSGRTHSYSEIGRNANHRYAIRDRRFKLLRTNGVWGLYDLETDPLETTNLYNSPAHTAVRQSLEAELAALKVGASAQYFQ
jgi:arylsulfatase A-like enzyme